MKLEQNYSLEQHNTFRLDIKTRYFMEYENEEELLTVLKDEYFQELYSVHIGSGSNLLFLDDFNGVVLHSAIKGMTVQEDTEDTVLLRIGAAELWDDVVAFAVENGWGGIENLSLIPGETGAAAIQNIGAYGVEIKDVLESVEAFNQLTFEKQLFAKEDCKYGYRTSIFKEGESDPYIITYVNLRLSKKPSFTLDYGKLRDQLANIDEISLVNVREAVIAIRNSKLPDPEKLGNAGSFFKNPVISSEQFHSLKEKYTDIPYYNVSEAQFKIPAGWLIEQCGFKGKSHGTVGIYEKQALVIVNLGGATGHEIALVAESIMNAVYDKFGIELTPEVKYIG